MNGGTSSNLPKITVTNNFLLKNQRKIYKHNLTDTNLWTKYYVNVNDFCSSYFITIETFKASGTIKNDQNTNIFF